MLRPYLAVIRDSFRAALSSRVLYIVLALIIVVLLIIAPLRVKEQVDWEIDLDQTLTKPSRLVARLISDGKSGKRKSTSHLWNRFSDSLKQELQEVADEGPDEELDPKAEQSDRMSRGRRKRTYENLVDELNQIVGQADFYDEQVFKGRRLPEEARTMIDGGVENLTEIQVKRLNRLLLDATLRPDITRAGAARLDVYYLTWHWSDLTTNISHAEFTQIITNQLPVYFDKFVMSIGIFIAILVTSSMIPDMLEPGSLNLLLSKPISRWGLLTAKFTGGCVFILLCAVLFFTGIWIWMGIQLGIWERGILISIPVYVLVFAMYYSVSVLAGIWFRSPILCVTFAILFWALCFVVGTTYSWLDNRLYNFGPMEMVAADDQLLYVDMLQYGYRWDEDKWKPYLQREPSPQEVSFAISAVFDRFDGFPNFPGPTLDSESERFLMGSAEIQNALVSARYQLIGSSSTQNLPVTELGTLPSGTLQMFSTNDGDVIAVTDSAKVYRMIENKQQSADTESGSKKPTSSNRAVLSFELISKSDSFDVSSANCICHNPANDEIAIYTRGDVVVLAAEDGQYQARCEKSLEKLDNRKMAAFVQYRGDNLVVALGNGRVYRVDPNNLESAVLDEGNQRVAIRSMILSGDGRYLGMVYRDGRMTLFDTQPTDGGTSVKEAGWLPAQGDIVAATFDEQNRLWIVDRFKGARMLDSDQATVQQWRIPPADWLTMLYRYALRPVYRFFPKPGEFYKLIAEVSAPSRGIFDPNRDLTGLPFRGDPWSPLRNGIVFMFSMLLISCLVFQRQDF